MKRKYIILSIVAVILFLVIGKCSGMFSKPQGVKVAIEKPQLRTIIEAIPANGKIQPVTEVKLSPDVSGEIVALNIKEGDKVERGQLLLKIKPDIYVSLRDQAEAALNSSKARLAQAESQLTQVEQTYNRNKQLHDQKVVSDADFESMQSQYNVAKKEAEAARFNVSSAGASLKKANEDLDKTTVYAPMSGTVSKLSVEIGERVLGTVQMAGTEMLRIANLNAMEVLVDVNENDITRVKLNDTAIVDVDAYPDKKFKGVVTQIANSAKALTATADQVTNFEVKILLLSTADGKEALPKLLPGMSASVSIQTKIVEKVLSIPIQAITARTDLTPSDSTKTDSTKTDSTKNAVNANDKLQTMVFIVQPDNKVKVVAVKTGIQDNSYIEVFGITENDEVVTAPYNAISKRLRKGSLVEKVPVDKLFEETK